MQQADKYVVWSQIGDFRKRREVGIFIRHGNGNESVAAPLVFTDCTNMLVDKPTVADGVQFLQAMMDHAWEIGLRPAGFADVPLQTRALMDHLHDMRALVFNRPQLIVPAGFEPEMQRSQF